MEALRHALRRTPGCPGDHLPSIGSQSFHRHCHELWTTMIRIMILRIVIISLFLSEFLCKLWWPSNYHAPRGPGFEHNNHLRSHAIILSNYIKQGNLLQFYYFQATQVRLSALMVTWYNIWKTTTRKCKKLMGEK